MEWGPAPPHVSVLGWDGATSWCNKFIYTVFEFRSEYEDLMDGCYSKLCSTPSPGEKWWAYLCPVNKCTVHMVQYIMEHPNIDSDHILRQTHN